MNRDLLNLCSTLQRGEAIMKALDKKIKKVCSICSSELRLRMIRGNEFILICVNVQCPFPFDLMPKQVVTLKFRKAENNTRTDIVSNENNVSHNIQIDEAQMKCEIEKVEQELKEIHKKVDTGNAGDRVNNIVDEIESLTDSMKAALVLGPTIHITKKMCGRIMRNSSLKVCPICRSKLSFKISGLESLSLLCAGEDCTFPIGYLDISLLRIKVKEIIKVHKSVNTKNLKPELLLLEKQADSILDKLTEETENVELEINRKEMKKLAKKLDDIRDEKYKAETVDDEQHFIKNESWIRNLVILQGRSGRKMVRPEELMLLKKPADPNINVVRGDDTSGIPTFTIEFTNK